MGLGLAPTEKAQPELSQIYVPAHTVIQPRERGSALLQPDRVSILTQLLPNLLLYLFPFCSGSQALKPYKGKLVLNKIKCFQLPPSPTPHAPGPMQIHSELVSV